MSLISYNKEQPSLFLGHPRQRGFTLIEVMVAVVVLAIGLLGLAGLQATSLRFNDSAYQRSQATALAYDMADRIRTNRSVALQAEPPGWSPYNTDFEASPNCVSGLIPTGTLVTQDIAAWRNALACVLPSGTGSIARQGTTNIFTIIVRWNDKREEADAANKLLEFSMDTEI